MRRVITFNGWLRIDVAMMLRYYNAVFNYMFLSMTFLTRALLGLVRTLPLAGRGGRIGPPSISETNRRGGKIQTAMERPGRDLSD